ncbi:hypothetical protein MKW94_005354 [Papaver nudicaule]|uniref:Bet v I/Major latex protein domain-containing protein n=1 Tax=Papaver nudicaule TaxID=74823 RepID=A0AA41VB90_PAPNU|nr:hypothetical protein [Papaver nudicaule]
MAQMHKLEVVNEVQCCGDKIYRSFTSSAPQLPKYLPKTILSVQVNAEGENRLGTDFVWKFIPDDESATVTNKARLTAVDNENKSVTWTVVEGDTLKYFDSFNFNLDVTPKFGGTSLVKWSVEYEKNNADVPDPIGLMKTLETME